MCQNDGGHEVLVLRSKHAALPEIWSPLELYLMLIQVMVSKLKAMLSAGTMPSLPEAAVEYDVIRTPVSFTRLMGLRTFPTDTVISSLSSRKGFPSAACRAKSADVESWFFAIVSRSNWGVRVAPGGGSP